MLPRARISSLSTQPKQTNPQFHSKIQSAKKSNPRSNTNSSRNKLRSRPTRSIYISFSCLSPPSIFINLHPPSILRLVTLPTLSSKSKSKSSLIDRIFLPRPRSLWSPKTTLPPRLNNRLEEDVSNEITSSRQFSTPCEEIRERDIKRRKERKEGREGERKGEGAAAVRARCPGHGSPTGSPAKGWRGVAMETLHCFPFPNYMAAGCQLESLKRIPTVDGKVRRRAHRCAPPSFLEAFASRVARRGVP